MKIYIVWDDGSYGPGTLYGAYSSREKAIEAFRFFEESLDESNIEEVEVDPINYGEPYSSCFLACAYSDGSTWESADAWRKTKMGEREASDKKGRDFISWEMPKDIGCSKGFGLTRQEAMRNAIAGLSRLSPVWQVARYRHVDGCPYNPDEFMEVKHAHPSHAHTFASCGHKGYVLHEDRETAKRILVEYETTGKIQPGLVPAKQVS